MKKLKTTYSPLLLGFLILITTSCNKENSKILPELNRLEILKIAKSAGISHNLLLDKVAKKININTVTMSELKDAFYSTKLYGDSYSEIVSPKTTVNKEGILDWDAFTEIHFKDFLTEERLYLNKIGKLPIRTASSGDFNVICSNLISTILDDTKLKAKSKLMLIGSIEVLRNSTLYWADAAINPNNPFFKKNNSSESLHKSLPSCQQWVDMIAYADFYNYYSSGGYNPTQASNAAWQDAAYNSGLAGLPGGSC